MCRDIWYLHLCQLDLPKQDSNYTDCNDSSSEPLLHSHHYTSLSNITIARPYFWGLQLWPVFYLSSSKNLWFYEHYFLLPNTVVAAIMRLGYFTINTHLSSRLLAFKNVCYCFLFWWQRQNICQKQQVCFFFCCLLSSLVRSQKVKPNLLICAILTTT